MSNRGFGIHGFHSFGKLYNMLHNIPFVNVLTKLQQTNTCTAYRLTFGKLGSCGLSPFIRGMFMLENYKKLNPWSLSTWLARSFFFPSDQNDAAISKIFLRVISYPRLLLDLLYFAERNCLTLLWDIRRSLAQYNVTWHLQKCVR